MAAQLEELHGDVAPGAVAAEVEVAHVELEVGVEGGVEGAPGGEVLGGPLEHRLHPLRLVRLRRVVEERRGADHHVAPAMGGNQGLRCARNMTLQNRLI